MKGDFGRRRESENKKIVSNTAAGRDEALILSLVVLLSSDRENTALIMALLYILS